MSKIQIGFLSLGLRKKAIVSKREGSGLTATDLLQLVSFTIRTWKNVCLILAAQLAANPAAAAVLPTFAEVDSALYQARRKYLPPLLQHREDIDLPDWLTV